MSSFFALIEVVLRALKVWDLFLDWLVDVKRAEIEERRAKRDQAINDSQKAETPDEIWKSQEDIANNTPRP